MEHKELNKEEIKKLLESKGNEIAVLKDKIRSLSAQIGVKASIEAIEEKQKEISTEMNSLEEELDTIFDFKDFYSIFFILRIVC